MTTSALEPSLLRRPLAGEVWVWWVRAGPYDAMRPAAFMNEEELARYAAIRRPGARAGFAYGCALLRVATAHHLGTAPGEIVIERHCSSCDRPHGKPRISGTDLEVSLSHTDKHIVCAVARHTPIGIDVEDGATLIDNDLLAENILAPSELSAYRLLPDERRRTALLTWWTRKEAVLKATGDGLRIPMRHLETSGPFEAPRLLNWTGRPLVPDDVTLFALDGAGAAAAALAVIGEPPGGLIEIDSEPALWSDLYG
ncbi:4'-phosphopantetheinyl transferase superfamily protein [Spongiactinospora sp. TRM90649]|uniref:4'-phosphopantetheinyl transferase family protein n=1 Tax=Spongiactinospora sp. TRM90649 TaxID=3031114 RepID=UPI0023F72A2B|nr:4'-phosphopantetheinyl transferase superfamily protein [Spongiactinospora sp. TRM90649]MDF5753565.1 4'-phosphopantetheinyl transferase superfamily protein [Spongiactinospora sp. TRM90649]